MRTESDDDFQAEHRYETTLRAIGQALEALGIESFEVLLDGDSFVVYGGSESGPFRERPTERRFRLFQRNQKQKTRRRGFYISGMRFSETDIARLDRQGKNIRISTQRCPDTNSLSHSLRMIGAHIDKAGLRPIGIVRNSGTLTLWHKTRSGEAVKQIFTHANLYDLWVHLYKKRSNTGSKRTGTTNT